MPDSIEIARRVAYTLLIVGVLLTVVWAIEPFYGAAYKLSLTDLAWGLLPYYCYSLLIRLPDPYAVLAPGVLLLGVDLTAHIQAGATGNENLTLYLPLLLTVVALPVGVAIGYGLRRVFGRQAGTHSAA
ncbi:MAG: hypothetical protein P8076_13515 [Gammaproteobacteria bacterium]